MGTRAAVDVFRYRDYRAYLAAFYARKKAQKDGYSFAEFSKAIDLRSPNYLKLVIDGQRNLTPSMAQRFGEACGLEGEPLSFFCALVAFNQAKTAKEKELQYARLQGFRRFRASHKLDAAHSAYHAEWYIPAIFELAARADFQDDPQWISKQLLPPIAPKQATQALDVLQELGLLIRDHHGRLVQAQSVVETPQGPLGHQIVRFHRTMMERAAESLDHVSREEREIAGLTLCISEDNMQALKHELEAFRQHLLERYMKDESPERVVQVNFQMFPLSQKKG